MDVNCNRLDHAAWGRIVKHLELWAKKGVECSEFSTLNLAAWEIIRLVGMPVTEDWLRKFQREVETLSGPFIRLCWRCQDHGMTAKDSSKSGVELV